MINPFRFFASPNVRIQGLDSIALKRILVCQQRQIGDVLLVTPLINVFHKLFPGVEVDVYTEKKCLPVLENNPQITRVWAIDKTKGFFDSLKFYRKVGRDGYDMIFDCQQLPRIRWMVMLSDSPVKMSFPPNWYNRLFYTHWNEFDGPYAAKCKAGPILRTFGQHLWDDPRPRLYLTDKEKQFAANFTNQYNITNDNTLITIDPTHRRDTRRWPAEHFAGLMRLVEERHPEARFLILWGPGEQDDARAVAELADLPDKVILPEELISLREMAAVIDRADLLIGNCSSPKHFAAALDTPALSIQGSTSPAWTCPTPGNVEVSLDLDCQPCTCNDCPEGHTDCLHKLLPEAVLPDALELLNAKKS